jgi:hypothetical protein
MKETVHLKRWLVPLLSLALLLGACASGPRAAQPSERQATARAMFQERCKKAGEFIHRTVENVEGIYLMKVRTTTNFDEQFKLDDPYGHDSTKSEYLLNFLRGFYHQRLADPGVGQPPRMGYLYIEAEDPLDGKRYRYTGGLKAVRKKDVTAPGIQFELRRNPDYDLNIYEFVLDKTPASGPAPRYGVSYDDISTLEEREYWIAGSSLKVIDLQTDEVIAERIGYMVDWAQGSRAGGRSPWLFAADTACPDFNRNRLQRVPGPSSSAQAGQTLDFVEKILKPSK